MANFLGPADTDHFVDYAHEGPGFPTWHRQLILWLEREIQVQIHDHTFRLPYWDWRDPSQREILFKRDRLGENVDGIVVGDLFTNWKTFCWENPTGLSYPVPLCDPTVSDNQILRRCPHPNTYLCERNGTNWPTYGDVKKALSIENYDTFPYTRFVEETGTSFRNYFEGFITRRGVDCGGDTMCTVDRVKNVTVVRKLHNSVSKKHRQVLAIIPMPICVKITHHRVPPPHDKCVTPYSFQRVSLTKY